MNNILLDYCPDCISIIDENHIVVSTYDFINDDTKTGVLLLLNKNLNIIDKLDCDGILHFKIINDQITICTWKGDVWTVNIQDNKFSLKNKQSFVECFQNIKLLYLDCNIQQSLLLGGDNGEVILQKEGQIIYQQKSHEYSVWCTLLDNTNEDLFYSGSDDACLNYYDARIGLLKKDKKSHSQGITYLLNDGEHNLITGSFDGYIRIFDKRQPNFPIEEYKREGGIWRIIKKGNQYLNGLFQEHKYELIEINNKQVQLIQEFKDHSSLAYAMDWYNNLIVTSSFYDKQLRSYII
ncbi:unnamed protein product [Paramecium pentaurelia]|uniref:Uncharacterized protein n=1 Tax=Paramecium pentaurelia TaxID=43138 RepID=A0A8S1WWS2_9CILI|nr:unnamed protein product [Paramecium pentaurelia]